MLTATPRSCNVAGPVLMLLETNSTDVSFLFAFATTNNSTYVVEHADQVNSSSGWQTVRSSTGDGIEQVYSAPAAASNSFYRLKRIGP